MRNAFIQTQLSGHHPSLSLSYWLFHQYPCASTSVCTNSSHKEFLRFIVVTSGHPGQWHQFPLKYWTRGWMERMHVHALHELWMLFFQRMPSSKKSKFVAPFTHGYFLYYFDSFYFDSSPLFACVLHFELYLCVAFIHDIGIHILWYVRSHMSCEKTIEIIEVFGVCAHSAFLRILFSAATMTSNSVVEKKMRGARNFKEQNEPPVFSPHISMRTIRNENTRFVFTDRNRPFDQQ